jgi:hypothetical protein
MRNLIRRSQYYANLTIDELYFEDVPVCVVKYREFNRILLGCAGWLQKVRLNLRPSNCQLEEVFYLQITVNQFLDVWENESYFLPAIEKKLAMPIRE